MTQIDGYRVTPLKNGNYAVAVTNGNYGAMQMTPEQFKKFKSEHQVSRDEFVKTETTQNPVDSKVNEITNSETSAKKNNNKAIAIGVTLAGLAIIGYLCKKPIGKFFGFEEAKAVVQDSEKVVKSATTHIPSTASNAVTAAPPPVTHVKAEPKPAVVQQPVEQINNKTPLEKVQSAAEDVTTIPKTGTVSSIKTSAENELPASSFTSDTVKPIGETTEEWAARIKRESEEFSEKMRQEAQRRDEDAAIATIMMDHNNIFSSGIHHTDDFLHNGGIYHNEDPLFHDPGHDVSWHF